MAIIQTSDFTGSYQVPQDQYTLIDLQRVIDEHEEVYLAKMFGAELSNDLLVYVNGGFTPVNPLFDFIYNPFKIDLNCELLISEGVKTALIGFVYYEWVVKNKIKPSQITGVERVKMENATSNAIVEPQVYNAYNKGVKTTNAIQRYILNNLSDYDKFNGRKMLLNYSM